MEQLSTPKQQSLELPSRSCIHFRNKNEKKKKVMAPCTTGGPLARRLKKQDRSNNYGNHEQSHHEEGTGRILEKWNKKGQQGGLPKHTNDPKVILWKFPRTT